MAFRILHEGNVILEIKEQVLSATLRTSRGSGPPTFLSDDDGIVELVIEKVPAGGPLRLDQLEAAQMQAIQDRGKEGELVGVTANSINGEEARIMATRQGTHTDTLGKGEGRNEDPPLGGFPTKDLSEGNDGDADKNTAAINEFNKGQDSAGSSRDDSGDGTPPDANPAQTKGSTVPASGHGTEPDKGKGGKAPTVKL